MSDLVATSLIEASTEVVSTGGDGTVQINSMFELWVKWAIVVVAVVAWLCFRMFVQGGEPRRDNSTDTAQIEARRKSAWGRKQAHLDELAAAAVAAKQERIRVKEEARASMLVVKEAKEKARICTRAADEARMRRRRAGDQMRVLGNKENRRLFEERRQEAEDRIREEKLASREVEQAVTKLEDLRRWLNDNKDKDS